MLKKNIQICALAASILFMGLIAACAKSGTGAQSSGAADESHAAESVELQGLLTEEIPLVGGPKRTVAVGKFGAIGAFTAKYGDWDVGEGLSAMMTTALVESERFVVLERANVSQILAEQEMKGAGIVNPETGPELGKLTGVQLLIYGAVTEFGTDDSGGGMSLGVAGGSLGSLLSGALSRQSTEGSVAMDIRVVDSSSGQVLDSHTFREDIDSSSWDVSAGYEGISLGTNQFYKTPLGQATRKVITKAVSYIANKAKETTWTGLVVDVMDSDIYINAGSSSGLKVGDRFSIERVVRKLTDPQTGEVLSVRKKQLGIVEVTGVEQKISYGSYTPIDLTSPQRGDFAVMAH